MISSGMQISSFDDRSGIATPTLHGNHISYSGS